MYLMLEVEYIKQKVEESIKLKEPFRILLRRKIKSCREALTTAKQYIYDKLRISAEAERKERNENKKRREQWRKKEKKKREKERDDNEKQRASARSLS